MPRSTESGYKYVSINFPPLPSPPQLTVHSLKEGVIVTEQRHRLQKMVHVENILREVIVRALCLMEHLRGTCAEFDAVDSLFLVLL